MKPLRLVQNNLGSMIASALIFAAISGVTILLSSIYISDRIKQTKITREQMDLRVTLDSLLAYTTNGIKQAWCFTPAWMQDSSCDLNNDLNVERLTLTDESLAYIGASKAPHPTPVSSTRINQISQVVNLVNISESHPLYLILSPFKDQFESVSFDIRRETSVIQTTKGREVPLRITIKMNAKPAYASLSKQVSSKIFIYPREVSYFSLILPRNLYLGSIPGSRGDNGLAAVNIGSGMGLRFESPVFVNDSLHLPPSGGKMSNVTFVEKIFLGGGHIKQDGNLFTPANAGGRGADFNTNIPSFPGILAGYEMDVERDMGLDYLFNLKPEATLDETLFNLCKARILASIDLTKTVATQLYTMVTSAPGGGTNTFGLSASIGSVDNLIDQRHSPSSEFFEFKTNVPGVGTAGRITSRQGGSVFKVRIIYDGIIAPADSTNLPRTYTTEFFVSRKTDAVVYPFGDSSATYPRIDISTVPQIVSGNAQFNQVNFNVSFKNVNSFRLSSMPSGSVYRSPTIKIMLEAMDYAYSYTTNLRVGSAVHPIMGAKKINGFTFYPVSNYELAVHNGGLGKWSVDAMNTGDLTTYVNYAPEEFPKNMDFVSFDKKCFSIPDTEDSYYMSFGAANWGASFADQSRRAWSFSPEFESTGGYFDGTIVFDSTSSRFPALPGRSVQFGIKSLVRDCVIRSSANFVTGFYTCENLTIEARSTPLRIIGTFIVGQLKIDSSAYSAGIRWSNIYHPSAVMELRAAGVLGLLNDGETRVSCNVPSRPPLWMPNVGVQTILAHFACNPVSLRKADPFKWSTIDPDCALDETAGKVNCKKRMSRFLVKEVSRSGDI